jgi:hypothetical protein
MYSTKYYVGKKVDSYISIGDDYTKPNTVKRTAFGGRQFQTRPPLRGNEGYFGALSYTASGYNDNTNYYRLSQPRATRNKGFGSMDANRRDEFSNSIRQAQMKEQIATEKKWALLFAEKGEEELEARNTSARAVRPQTAPVNSKDMFQTRVSRHLYDVAHNKGKEEGCNKCARDTFYCRHRARLHAANSLRRTGGSAWRTTQEQVGKRAWNAPAQKSKHGKSHSTQEFLDNSHLSF